MNKKSILHKTLARALSVKRPHNTPAVSDFTEWLFNALPAELKSFTSVDGAGNLHIDNRIAGSKTRFIAHVDTVHKDTGVNLSVTPSVNSGNMVSMQLNQSVTDVGSIDAATGQRSFLQRQIGSKVAVRSGETIVLGGLIRDNSTVGRTGIPFLSDIPIVGNLFGTSSKNSGRTELLVMITPRVVRSDQEIKDLANDVRERMKGLLPGKLFPTAPIDWTPDLGALKPPAQAAERR